MRRCPLWFVGTILVASMLFLATTASAQDEAPPPDAAPVPEAAPVPPPERAATPTNSSSTNLLAPAKGRFFVGLQFGPAASLSDSVGQFKIGQEFGWHVLNPGFGALAIGAYMSESFGSSLFVFTIGPKAWWHFQPLSNLGLYIGPFLQLGLVHSSVTVDTGPYSVSGSSTGFNWQLGVDGRLALAEHFYVLVKPLGIDFNHGDGGTFIRWDLMFGGGYIF